MYNNHVLIADKQVQTKFLPFINDIKKTVNQPRMRFWIVFPLILPLSAFHALSATLST